MMAAQNSGIGSFRSRMDVEAIQRTADEALISKWCAGADAL
jgi:hypothetical protein